MPKVSIIIPFFNEEENVADVLGEVIACQPHAEIIAVNDASVDNTWREMEKFPSVRRFSFVRNLGQSAAFYHGLHMATGDICVMMDGDGQNDPADIQTLLQATEFADVVCGYRRKRMDSIGKRIASRLANRIRRSILMDGIRDTGCSLKAMRREHVRFLMPFNGLHRFLPAVLKNAGLSICEVAVNHRPRMKGVSKYTVGGRAIRGLRDLFGVQWLLARHIKWGADPHVIPTHDIGQSAYQVARGIKTEEYGTQVLATHE